MGVEIRQLRGGELRAEMDAMAFLRIVVFEDYPYLYVGDLDFEREYLTEFARSPNAVLIGAYASGRLVGAGTAAPLAEYKPGFCRAFADRGFDIGTIFYFGESVLLPEYRGRGIGHRFFDAREAAARDTSARQATFCAVDRTRSDVRVPAGYRPLDPFWRARGYEPVPGLTVEMGWEEHGMDGVIDHTMQFWLGNL